MLVFALLIGQALGLPEVENPIPEKMGLADVFAFAGAGGVIGGILATTAWPRRRDEFITGGTLVGFSIGVGIYSLSLAFQLLS